MTNVLTMGGSFSPPADIGASTAGRLYRRHGDHLKRYEFVRQMFDGVDVLDFGCGHGFGSTILKDVVRSYTGVDPDPSAVSWACRNLTSDSPPVTFLRLGAGDGALKQRRYDGIIAFEVIEHVPDPKSLILLLKSLAKPDGRIVISTPNGSISQGDRSLYSSPFHIREFTHSQLKELIGESARNLKFYKERRVDRLDTLLNAKLSPRHIVRQRFESLCGLSRAAGAPVSGRLQGFGRQLFFSTLNQPLFWRILPADDDEFAKCDYTSIIAEFTV